MGEEEIVQAMQFAYERLERVIEPSNAVALVPLLRQGPSTSRQAGRRGAYWGQWRVVAALALATSGRDQDYADSRTVSGPHV